MVTVYCKDEKETENFGKKLGKFLQNGDVLNLNGDLGTGKTTLTKAIAKAKGVEEDVTSPTFAIMNIYKGTGVEIKHFDLYRINRAEELDDIGFYEYAGSTGITIIEWGNLFVDELPEERLDIEIARKGEGRDIVLSPRGAKYEDLLEKVQNC